MNDFRSRPLGSGFNRSRRGVIQTIVLIVLYKGLHEYLHTFCMSRAFYGYGYGYGYYDTMILQYMAGYKAP